MAIFSLKSKGKKADTKKEEVKKEEAVKPVESKPAQFRKYTPRHLTADGQEPSQDGERISISSQMRKQHGMFEDASYQTHGTSTPTSSVGRRKTTNDAFTTHANDYFSPGAMRRLQANDPALGYTKVALARQDQGLAQGSSDSGYESAGPSRVPSEHNLDDMSRQHIPRPNGNLLPELRLGDDSLSDRSSKSATKKTRFQVDTEPPAEPIAPATEHPSLRNLTFTAPAAVVDQPVLRQVEQPALPSVQQPVSQLAARRLNLGALEGHKLNKKGKVLDEEGDVIGELVEGDLLDCVRQKVNSSGEVLDDVGKIVGIVRLAVTSGTALPALTIRPATASPPTRAAHVERESSPPRAPRSPVLEAAIGAQSPQDAARRAPRSASERTLSELSKPYARPPMSSVPENNVAGEDEIAQASPELFAYKGEIPVAPPQHIRRRSSSPPTLSAYMNARKPTTRRGSSSAMSSISFGKQPVGYASRRPLSSYDNSPNGSDDGTETSTSDDGKLPSIMYNKMRPGSVRSAMTVPARPKTYFTHGGKVTVDPNAPPMPTQTPDVKSQPAAEEKITPAKEAVKEEKNKGKFGLRFGKK